MEVFLDRLKHSHTTLTLMAINIILWLLIKLTSPAAGDSRVLVYGMGQNQLIAQGEVWRLLTSAFMHEEAWHIFANMYFLALIGPFIEWIYTRRSYILIVIVTIIYSSLVSFAFGDSYSYSLGFSGAGYGMLGVISGLLFFYRKDKLITPIAREMMPMILITALIPLFMADIDHFAHIGGLVSGFLLCGVLQSEQKREIKNASYICIGIIVLTALGLSIYGYYRNQNLVLSLLLGFSPLI